MRYLLTNILGLSWGPLRLPLPSLLRSLLSALIVLALPQGAGVALIALASTMAWRLPQLLTVLPCKCGRSSGRQASSRRDIILRLSPNR